MTRKKSEKVINFVFGKLNFSDLFEIGDLPSTKCDLPGTKFNFETDSGCNATGFFMYFETSIFLGLGFFMVFIQLRDLFLSTAQNLFLQH